MTDMLDFGRDSGVRAGFAFRFAAGWDLDLDYTYFFTAHQALVGQGAPGVWELLATRSIFNTTPMQSVAADGSLRLNIVDLAANWRSYLSDTVGFRAVWRLPLGRDRPAVRQHLPLHPRPHSHYRHDPPADHHECRRRPLRRRAGVAGSLRIARLRTRGAVGLARRFPHAALRERHRSAIPLLDVPVSATQVVPVLEAAVGVAWAGGPASSAAATR